MVAAAKRFPCIRCDANVGYSTDAIQCTGCELWNHRKCGIDDKVWELMNAIKENQGYDKAPWLCSACMSKKNNCNNQMKVMQANMDAMKSQMDAMMAKMVAFENIVKEKDNEVVTLRKEISALKDNRNISENEESLNIKTVMNELNEQESRKCNVICHNIPESTSFDIETRKQYDLEFSIQMIFNLGIDVYRRDIVAVKRLGKRMDKPRPMMIIFYEASMRDEVLEKKSRLSYADEDWKLIKLSPDLTQRQREHDKEVFDEVEKKNAERTEEEALNFQYRAVGQQGRRKILKMNVTQIRRGYPTLGNHVEAALQERENNSPVRDREVRRGHGFSTQMLEDY